MSKNEIFAVSLASPEGTSKSGVGCPGYHATADPESVDRRTHDRFIATWAVDCATEDTFLYASMANISSIGIFVRTTDPLPIGTLLWLSFAPPGCQPFMLEGRVAWINRVRTSGDNPNPGMGVRFVGLTPMDRERLVEVVRSIAYICEPN